MRFPCEVICLFKLTDLLHYDVGQADIVFPEFLRNRNQKHVTLLQMFKGKRVKA